MCGLIELHVCKGNQFQVLHYTREELKNERIRLNKEGYIITFTKVL